MEHVKRGKLKLKGGASLKVAHDAATRKKSKKHKKHKNAGGEGADDARGDGAQEDIVVNDMTPAQRRHEAHRKKREQAEIEKVAGKTYRERVEELNQYLGSLTEHHDIPRVSAAGNG
ncbi:hypothetical protein PybrP1_004994 [[Pythium] brassicae (nom. inval.)]|nr:hypothetical protein PybrP1_004994 [[Pythium] brassicae (nom. inval.)]